VAARTEALGAKASRPEARAFAAMLAALPPEERAAMAAADIRALVAPANDALASGDTRAVTAGDGRRTVTRIEADALHVADRERPLRIESTWTIDEATGLVLRERRQSWLAQPQSGGRTLVEERVRALSLF
jgi:hypothetical protein